MELKPTLSRRYEDEEKSRHKMPSMIVRHRCFVVTTALAMSLTVLPFLSATEGHSADHGKAPPSMQPTRQFAGKLYAQLDQLRADMALRNEERIDNDLAGLFETIGKMPNSTAGRREAQKLSEELWKIIRDQDERAGLSY